MILKFAIRNLTRHWRRTAITVIAMTFGLAISFWLDCMLRGRNEEVIKLVTGSFAGHYQVYQKQFFDEKLISSQLALDIPLIEQSLSGKAATTERVYLPSLISSGEYSLPVILYGIQPEKEKRISNIFESTREGEYLNSSTDCSPAEVLIGAKLAQALKVSLDEKVVLLTQSADGNLGNELFRVKGIFDTGSSNFDKVYIFAHENCAKSLGVVDGPHEMVVKLDKSENEETVYGLLKKLIDSDHILTSWEQTLPTVARMVNVNNAIMSLVSGILLVVVILGFVNTLLMSVLERTREIGMMMALGMTPGQVRLTLSLEALLMGIISSVLAIILGSLAVLYYYKTGFDLSFLIGKSFEADQFNVGLVIFPKISIWPFVKVIGFSLFIVVISVAIPVYRASRLSPLDAIRS